MLGDITDKVTALETSSFLQLQDRRSGAPIRVAFISDLYTYWHCYSSIVMEFVKRPRFDPVVLPLFSYEEDSEKAAQLIQDAVKPFSINELPFVSEEKYKIHRERPDIVFFQSPYTAKRKLGYHPTILRGYNIQSALIPYCTEFLGGGQFMGMYFVKGCPFWRSFVASSMSRTPYTAILQVTEEDVPIVGNPEYDVVVGKDPETLLKYQKIRNMAQGRRIFLWTPHYSLSPPFLWSTWNTLARDMITIFNQCRERAFVVLRPHQLLAQKLASWQPGTVPADPFQELAKVMHEAGNFWLDLDGLAIESVLACDALISDVSSMITKAMALKKSVLYTARSDGDGAGPAEKVLSKYVHTTETIKGVQKYISMVLRKEDPLLPIPENILESFCGPVDGKAAVRIADALEEVFFPK